MLECCQCEKEDRCLKRGRFARTVWLAMVHGLPEPVCADFEERRHYEEWRRLRRAGE